MKTVRNNEVKAGQIIKCNNPLFRYLVAYEGVRVRLISIPGYHIVSPDGIPDEECEVLSNDDLREWMDYVQTEEYHKKIRNEAQPLIDLAMVW